jgi:anti-anti-sigma factor
VVLDLRGVTFIDSSGIHVLIRSHRHAESRGAHLSTVVGGAPCRAVLEMSGAIDYLDVA